MSCVIKNDRSTRVNPFNDNFVCGISQPSSVKFAIGIAIPLTYWSNIWSYQSKILSLWYWYHNRCRLWDSKQRFKYMTCVVYITVIWIEHQLKLFGLLGITQSVTIVKTKISPCVMVQFDLLITDFLTYSKQVDLTLNK